MTENPKKEKHATPIQFVDLKDLQLNETVEGYTCDVNTGVCGPISKEKEVKE